MSLRNVTSKVYDSSTTGDGLLNVHLQGWPIPSDSQRTRDPISNAMEESAGATEAEEPVSQISELDSDLEPDQLIERYLELQTRLFSLDPNFVDPKKGKLKKTITNRPAAAQTSSKRTKSKTSQIEAQISTLLSDVLFDKQQADTLWESKFIALCREGAERKRLEIESHKDIGGIRAADDEIDEEDPEIAVGDLFSALPDFSKDATGNSALVTSQTGETQLIQIRDFGTWSGVSPRRVLDDACKAR